MKRLGWFDLATASIIVLILALGYTLSLLETRRPNEEPNTTYAGKRILWVASYHEGNPWNEGIGRGIQSVLAGTGVELHIVRMDTAPNTNKAFKREAARQALAAIREFEPDVVIASDDNAQEYLVVPYLKDTELPVVFCGVNWDASTYGYPASNITGMIEVDPVAPLIQALREHAAGERVGYLSGDTETQAKVTKTYNDRFFDGTLEVRLVRTFEEFQREFVDLQREVDMLITGNYVGIRDWDEAAAQRFVRDNTQIPTGYVDGHMLPWVLVTIGKIPEEQGEYAASTALKILAGVQPSDLALVINKRTALGINLDIAEKLGIVFMPSIVKNAETVYPGP